MSPHGMGVTEDFDVVVVGASLAGCATATLLGREGFRVALVDKHRDASSYKGLCGHYIQSSATPVIERLGLDVLIEAAGGVRNGIDISTTWGLIGSPVPLRDRAYGFSLRRKKLDPLLRGLATELPTVDYRPGLRAVEMSGDGSSAATVSFVSTDGARVRMSGRLVVGADGRNSAVARMAQVKEKRSANNRFCYGSYFTGVDMPGVEKGRMWLRDRDIILATPQDDGLTLIVVFGHRRGLDRFKEDRRGALLSSFEGLLGLDLSRAEFADKITGFRSYELMSRRTAAANVALVGDAALASDPATGVGCGWALQAAGWLADTVTSGLREDEDLQDCLESYARLHRRNLRGHHVLAALGARGRPLNPLQRLLFSAGVTDPIIAQRLIDFGERTIPPRELLGPATVGRALANRVGRPRKPATSESVQA